MMCGLCESHVNVAVRKFADVKIVSYSHSKSRTEIITEEPLDEEGLKKAIDDTGYRVLSIKTEPYKKKGFSLFGR